MEKVFELTNGERIEWSWNRSKSEWKNANGIEFIPIKWIEVIDSDNASERRQHIVIVYQWQEEIVNNISWENILQQWIQHNWT